MIRAALPSRLAATLTVPERMGFEPTDHCVCVPSSPQPPERDGLVFQRRPFGSTTLTVDPVALAGLPSYALALIILLVLLILATAGYLLWRLKGSTASQAKLDIDGGWKSAPVPSKSSSFGLEKKSAAASSEADIEQPLHRDEPQQITNALRIQNEAGPPASLQAAKPRRSHEGEVNVAIAAATAQATIPDYHFMPDRKEIKKKLREYETTFEQANGFKPRKKAEWGEMWGDYLK